MACSGFSQVDRVLGQNDAGGRGDPGRVPRQDDLSQRGVAAKEGEKQVEGESVHGGWWVARFFYGWMTWSRKYCLG